MSPNLPPNVTPSKDNVNPNSPTHEEHNSLGPPVHLKSSMCDSTDPIRNPLPLPPSPLFVKTNSLVSSNSSPSNVDKLKFTQIDSSEIEHQLKRLSNAQLSLKSLLSGIGTSVKQTQIDLDNLVVRSLNNNSHLKDLLQSVSNANKDANDLSEKRVNELLHLYINPLDEKLCAVEQLKEDLSKQFDTLKELKLDHDPIIKEINTSASSISDKMEALFRYHDDLVEKYEYLVTCFTGNTGQKLSSEVQKSNETVTTTIKELVLKIEDLNITELLQKFNQTSNSISEKVESIKQVDLSKIKSTLNGLKSGFDSINDNLVVIKSQTEFQDSQRSLEVISDKMEKILNQKPEFPTKIIMQELDIKHADLLENLEILKSNLVKQDHSKSITQLEETLNIKFAAVENLSSKAKCEEINSLKIAIEKKQLENQLKDKDIEDLKKQLSEYSKKEELSKNILEIMENKVKLEVKFNSLNEAYTKRYEEFKKLSDDHEALVSKLLSINLEKLTSIMGNAALSSQRQSPEGLKSSSNPKAYVSNRVLSSNSYLSNTQTGTPKGLKQYDLKPIDDEDDENKENIS